MTAPTFHQDQVRAFIDTNVIVAYAEGAPDAVRLFSASVIARTEYLINPIVVQELLLGSSFERHPGLETKVLDLTIIPIETIDSPQLLEEARRLRNRSVHVNEFLIFASARECDFLITYDDKFKILDQDGHPSIVTPREFLQTIAAA
jgi:predicted nucleic acid-binding protein